MNGKISPDDPTNVRAPEDTPTSVDASQAGPLQLTPGTILGNRYRIVSLIGRGGMGEVYRADDLKLGQAIALKFVSRHELADRLYEEVRIGRQVSHPNVCRLHDIAEVDGRLFITMEFVDGEDLASLLRRIGRLPVEKALMLTRDICAGLAAAHEKGVIHRDLKPGNVMIDGRGRARIADFGLAIPGESGTSDSAGTPGYMAPEQYAGEAASIKSDIYALGLMLYEIFTGRRAFDATSTHDLLVRQQRGDFARPSTVIRDIPPAVEQVIVRCLNANPAGRPASVEALMRELPGFDPLAAAIAAGETPSPGMVAASSERGDLSRGAAWGLLSLCILALIVYAALTARTMLFRRVPVLKSPDILADRVNEILAVTNQPLTRADSAVSVNIDQDQLQWRGKRPLLENSPLHFHFRQSPRPMHAVYFEHRVTQNDPPLVIPGMADVDVDASGRLIEFVIVPRQIEPPAAAGHVDWSPFLAFAGVSATPISATPSSWTAPVDSDEKHAWTVGSDGTRIEAASYHGKPVWFAIIPPWRQPVETEVEARAPMMIIKLNVVSSLVMVVLVTAWMIVAVLLATRNMRRGQGDRRGATAIAIFFFVTTFISLAVRAHHTTDVFSEWLMLLDIAFISVFLALAAGLSYVAIEPLIRRRWPRMLIGWSRLIEQRWHDPMIGRDLLIGTTGSVIMATAWQLTALVPGAAPLNTVGSILADLRNVGYFAGFALIAGIMGALMAAIWLLALHVVTRSLRLSFFIYFCATAVVFFGDATGPFWSRAAYAVICVAAALAVLYRFGLLAMSFMAVPWTFLRAVPVTLDASAWYFGRSLFALLLIVALALCGFFISLGGKRWLPEITVDA